MKTLSSHEMAGRSRDQPNCLEELQTAEIPEKNPLQPVELSENYTRSSRSPAFLNYHPYLDGHWGMQPSLSHFCSFEKPFTPYFSNSNKIHWFSKLDFHRYLLWCVFSSPTGLSRHLFIPHQASCLMTTSPQSCHIICHVATSILDNT